MNKVEALHASLGRFLLAWADLEVGVDLLVLSLRQAMSSEQRKARLPHQLAAKIAFLRDRVEVLVEPPKRQNAIKDLLLEVERLAVTRHDFVHGAAIDRRVGKVSATVTVARLLQPDGRPRRPPIRVTTAQINETADRVYALGDRLFDVVQAVDDAPRAIH
jgi:hypothetical protein